METIFQFLDKIIVGMDKVGLPASLCCVGPVAVILVIWELITGEARKSIEEDRSAD